MGLITWGERWGLSLGGKGGAYHWGGKVGMRCYVTDGHVAMKYVVNVTRNKNKTAVTNVTRGTHTSRKYDLVT